MLIYVSSILGVMNTVGLAMMFSEAEDILSIALLFWLVAKVGELDGVLPEGSCCSSRKSKSALGVASLFTPDLGAAADSTKVFASVSQASRDWRTVASLGTCSACTVLTASSNIE